MTRDDARRLRLLVLSFSYWPMVNARAFRWTAIAEEWARRGHDVAVVCAWLPERPRYERVNGVHVHRAGVSSLERLRWRLHRRRTRSQGAADNEHVSHAGLFVSLVAQLNERVWRNLYWPDTTCLWYFPVLRRARALTREMRPDGIFSVSPTFTAVAAARSLMARDHPSGRWIIDLGDPFSFAEEAPPNNFRLYRRLNVAYERGTFSRAAAIAVTNHETCERYAALFPESAAKITVVPPLVALPGLDRPSSADSPPEEVSLVFLGTLYRSIRPPDFFLALFERMLGRGLVRLRLHVFGDVRDCEGSFTKYGSLLGSRIVLHGVVPREEAVQAMLRATVLVNIGNRTTYQLPSKLVEYAAMGKPILNLAAVEGDSSTRFLRQYPRQLTLLANEAGPSDEQVFVCERFLQEAWAHPEAVVPRDWLTPFTIRAVASRYLGLIDA